MDNRSDIYDLIILGGGCAGLTAGIYAGRAKLKTIIIEKLQPGGQAATTDDIENYPGFNKITGPELTKKMLEQAKSFGSEFVMEDVKFVSLQNEVKEVVTSSGTYKSRTVIIATGASPKKLGFDGEVEFRGRGVGYCATCDGFFFEGKDIFVIGGGFSAAEEALYLTRFGKKVIILVRKDKFKCAQSIVDKVMTNPKIEVRFNTEMVRAYGKELLEGAELKNNKTGEIYEYKVPEEDGTFGIFVFIGHSPASEMFKAQVDTDNEGYIITNDKMETNIKGVYAAGDIRPKTLRQIVTATSDGATAATNAEKYVEELKERLGIKEEYSADTVRSEEISRKEEKGVLTDELREQVLNVFEKLNKKITIVTITDNNNEKSIELKNFLEEVSNLSPYINLKVYEKGENSDMESSIAFEYMPVAAILDSEGVYTGLKFCGIPSGHEFNSFILAIYNTAGPGQVFDKDIIKRINEIDKRVYMQIAVSLSCHFCPEVVAAAQKIASLNKNIEAEMIDISLFPDIKRKYNIMSVPALIINKSSIFFGSKSIEDIVDIIEKGD